MYMLLVIVAIPAVLIGLIEFPTIIKKKKYGSLIVAGAIWSMAFIVASLQVLGFEMVSPLNKMVEILPPIFEPIIEFLIPE